MKNLICALLILFPSSLYAEGDSKICLNQPDSIIRLDCYNKHFRKTVAIDGAATTAGVVFDLFSVIRLIEDLEFRSASEVLGDSSFSEYELAVIEQLTLTKVKPLPASKAELNMDGYDLLSKLDPSNKIYQTKLDRYRKAVVLKAQRAVLFSCFDSNFGTVTKNFVVEGKNIYAKMGHSFDPKEDYVNPTKHWSYLGGGRFKHKMLKGITSCNATKQKIEKPKMATAKTAIGLCFKAIRKDPDTPNPQMPKKNKYSLLTKGEYKTAKRDKKYGTVVIEAERKGWFIKGLHLVICQVNLVEHDAFVLDFSEAQYGYVDFRVSDWYKIRRTDLIKKR